jgi:hypothetical protein
MPFISGTVRGRYPDLFIFFTNFTYHVPFWIFYHGQYWFLFRQIFLNSSFLKSNILIHYIIIHVLEHLLPQELVLMIFHSLLKCKGSEKNPIFGFTWEANLWLYYDVYTVKTHIYFMEIMSSLDQLKKKKLH